MIFTFLRSRFLSLPSPRNNPNVTSIKAFVLVQRVEELRVVEQDLIRQRPRNIFPRPQRRHQLALFRRVLMAVIRTDDQMIFTGESGNVIDILGDLAPPAPAAPPPVGALPPARWQRHMFPVDDVVDDIRAGLLPPVTWIRKRRRRG